MKLKEFIAKILLDNGVSTVFTLPAYYITELTATLKRSGINTIEMRSEHNVSFATNGFSLINEGIGVMCINTGPSLMNALAGIKTAMKENIPILILVGVQEEKINNNESFFQTINITSDYANKVYTLSVRNIKLLEESIQEVLRPGHGGPVIVKVPVDQLNEKVEELDSTYLSNHIISNIIFNMSVFKSKIEKYFYPLFLFGQGMHAEKSILTYFPYQFVTTIMAKEYGIYSSNKNYLGTIGVLGDKKANIALASCDILICVGSRLSERTIMNNQSILINKHIIYVNNSDNICKYENTTSEIINCDACEFTQYFVKLKSNSYYSSIRVLSQNQEVDFNHEMLTTDTAVKTIFSSSLASSVFCIDDGLYTLSSLKYNQHGKIIFYGSMAAGGSSVGSAIGAYYANPNQQVIVLIGDGGILSVLGELQTIEKQSIPIIVFLINNNGYESIEQWFRDSYSEPFGFIDFFSIAKGFGIDYLPIYNLEELYDFAQSSADKKLYKPILVELMVHRQDMISHFKKREVLT